MSDTQNLVSRLQGLSNVAAFNAWLKLEVVSAAPDSTVELHLPWRPEFGQYGGFLHAAIVGGLLDTACGFAAFVVTNGPLLASQFSVRCLRPAIAEIFVVRGRVVKPGRQQIFAAAELAALSAPDRLLATGDAILVPTG